jgi:hypothetical protein
MIAINPTRKQRHAKARGLQEKKFTAKVGGCFGEQRNVGARSWASLPGRI